METKVMTPQMRGLIIGLVLIVISVVMQITITDYNKMRQYGWVSFALIVGAIIWATLSFAKEMDGNVTFGNVFAYGFKTTAAMTIIVLAYTLLAVTVLFPEMKEKALEAAREQMVTEGQLNDTQIDQAIAMTDKFFLAFSIGGVVLGYLFIGAIGSVIGATFAKKNPNPNPF